MRLSQEMLEEPTALCILESANDRSQAWWGAGQKATLAFSHKNHTCENHAADGFETVLSIAVQRLQRVATSGQWAAASGPLTHCTGQVEVLPRQLPSKLVVAKTVEAGTTRPNWLPGDSEPF